MFTMVFSHKEIAKPFLEEVLGIKMQMEDTREISKRARFYQAMRDSEALCRGEKYRTVYRFKNLETDDPKIEMGDHTFKNYYAFNKYHEVAEKAIRDYMEYFATNKANTPATEDIDRLVKWYQTATRGYAT